MAEGTTALTSGRFDPPHPGHILNIIKIARKYSKTKVVMLDSPERRYPISYSIQILHKIFDHLTMDVEFIVNKTHFGKITREELASYDSEIYVGGNLNVLRHIEKLGMPTGFIDRSYYYEASKIPLPE